MALHCAKYSGLASSAALDVQHSKQGGKETIKLAQGHARASRHRRPPSMLVSMGISKCAEKGLNVLDREIDAKFYRRGMLNIAKTKYLKVKQSFKKKIKRVTSR